MSVHPPIQSFVARWRGAQGAERANYQLFLSELCDVLDLPRPDPAGDDASKNAYCFERYVEFLQPVDGQKSGRIDLYKRGAFVLEAKQYRDQKVQTDLDLAAETDKARKSAAPVRGTTRWDDAMLKARVQAERYARALPADEDPPPFVLVVDVGHSIEVFADFTQKGKAYLPFPDSTSHRFLLADLEKADVQARLRAIWTDPQSLDPAKHAAEVTRDVARYLAELAKSFEGQGHDPKLVADFLARCLFCMFAEDVGLLPKESFSKLLNDIQGDPGAFVPLVEALFKDMDKGAYSTVLRQKLLRFNGGLFSDHTVLKINGTQLGLLQRASKLDWRNVEPSIFGTLLERALHPDERHKLGAHYTPRAYVERLVLPTVIEPLREEWSHARAAAITHARNGKLKEAVGEVRSFHDELCKVRVLDPACGSGNFLYVTLEHMKRLEGEVIDQLQEFGDKQALLDLATVTVDPHQFLGLEVNPRAAAVADLVLWIGYLQWHFRTRGRTLPAEPVLRKFDNIQCRDAVLAYDEDEPVTWLHAAEDPKIPGLPDGVKDELAKRADEIKAKAATYRFKFVDVWDRKSYKRDPATGRDVPDETKRTHLHRYTNPRPAMWPGAEYIVGNPPFLGTARMREDLGDGYAETLRNTYPDVPESADFVMYWWHKAAGLVRTGKAKRFGLITTNSLRQTFNRRVVQSHLAPDTGDAMSLVFAIPDHPWVDTAEGAAVRIAMTVGVQGAHKGELLEVTRETDRSDGASDVTLSEKIGKIQADLTTGAAVAEAHELQGASGLCHEGIKPHGEGFLIDGETASSMGRLECIRPYLNGRDLTDKPRRMFIIDLFGLSAEEARRRFPAAFDHVLKTVKPERDQNKRATYKDNWWIFGEPRRNMRPALAGLRRYIVTVKTAKHRLFSFVEGDVLPDSKLIAFALDDAYSLGTLSSRIHCLWALRSGSWLGYGNDPTYVKSASFDKFPFPVCSDAKKERIRALAEELDAHRKRAQAAHGVGLTDMYNVLEKLRAGEALSAKEKLLHDKALIATLKQLHDDLDTAVADAYDWPWPMSDEEILERVVALNKERAAEEARGVIRWLRPDYQNPPTKPARKQVEMELGKGDDKPAAKAKATKAKKLPWPKTLPERVRAVENVIKTHGLEPAPALAKRFLRVKTTEIHEILDTLATLGRI